MTIKEFLEIKRMELRYQINTKINLDDVIRMFLSTKQVERRSNLTVKSYKGILAKFEGYIGGEINFGDIDQEDVRRYLATRIDLSSKTLYNYHACLSSFWSWAVDNAYSRDNLVRKIHPPKYIKRQIVPFSEAEIRKLIKLTRYTRNKAILMILIDCGIRASELVNLKVEDWRPGMLKVLGKGAKERMVPISEPTERLVSIQLSQRKIGKDGIMGGEALFVSLHEPYAPINYPTVENLMRRLGKRADISDVHCHRFRHTFAINYLRNGGDIYTLQKILGHTTLEMVKNYLDIARSDVTAAHAKASPVLKWGLR